MKYGFTLVSFLLQLGGAVSKLEMVLLIMSTMKMAIFYTLQQSLKPNPSIKRDWRKRALNKLFSITRVEPPMSPAPYFKR
jgi:hypothetical protein